MKILLRFPILLMTVALLFPACSGGSSGGGKKHGSRAGSGKEVRSSCLACHQPLDADGNPTGIEEAHPWAELSCVDCHGGNPNELSLAGAHVPSRGITREMLRSLTNVELNQVDRAYLQFQNPGDLRVLDETCAKCHPEAAQKVKRSMMAHTSGEVTVARFRAGAQADAKGRLGAVAAVDPDFDPSLPTTVERICR